MRLRVGNARPLLIAIGPGAAAEFELWHSDVELFDVTIFDELHASSCELRVALDALDCVLLDGRFAVACLFDVRDEGWWPVASSVAKLIADRGISVRLFVCCDPRPRQTGRSAMLGRLARHLDSCVIEAPHEPGGLVRAAMLPLVGLVRCGLTGFDPTDLAVVLRTPSVGRVAFGIGRQFLAHEACNIPLLLREPRVSNVVVEIRCDAETTLNDVDAISRRVFDAVPCANVMMSTPSGERFEVRVLALHSTT